MEFPCSHALENHALLWRTLQLLRTSPFSFLSYFIMVTSSSVSIQTFAPQDNGLSGEYTTLPLLNSTSLQYVLSLYVLTVITGRSAPLLFLRILCWFMCILVFIP